MSWRRHPKFLLNKKEVYTGHKYHSMDSVNKNKLMNTFNFSLFAY